MLDPIFDFVNEIQQGAAADPTGTMILVAIGAVAILAAIVAMAR